MNYLITMLTLSQPIPAGTSGTERYMPWVRTSGTLNLTGAQLGTVTVSDDDPELNSGFYSGTSETDQSLVSDTVLSAGTPGEVTLTAGTRLSNFIGSIIRHVDADGNRFDYAVVYPRSYQPGGLGTELGGRYTVMVFPYSATNAANDPIPHQAFDPTLSFSFLTQAQLRADDDGQMMTPQDVQCFAEDTIIDTLLGERAIQNLRPGDLIRTRDNGMRWLRWVGRTVLSPRRLAAAPQLRPIRIRAGALGPGMPASDLTVSPQHRILVKSVIAQRMFGEDEILVAAKHLLDMPGVGVVDGQTGVTYYHMLFDDHEILRSNGAWTESLYVGPYAISTMGAQARREVTELFPQLADPGFQPVAARRLLSGREGRQLARRHHKNGKRLIGQC
ncbi:Hint domain-containing protein [Paracoccus homiensis]|uniref:Hint domain-containing protein n=1 Tax=Paracoccus homiensis TaxID=364199 RepID=UPI00398CAE9E